MSVEKWFDDVGWDRVRHWLGQGAMSIGIWSDVGWKIVQCQLGKGSVSVGKGFDVG